MIEQSQGSSPSDKSEEARMFLEELGDRLGMGEEISGLIDHLRQPEVREEMGKFALFQFEVTMSQMAILRSLRDLTDHSESPDELRTLGFANELLSSGDIGLIFDNKIESTDIEDIFRFETVNLSDGRSILIIRHHRLFPDKLIDQEERPQALAHLKEVVQGVMDAYGDLVSQRKFVSFENVDPETVRSLYG